MKQFYGYIRVSTARQGEHGVSLQEQRSAIERYAEKNSLSIVQLFEEQETAAKRGRPVFTRMLKLLQSGQAAGVIIHKIDRSARNLRDWADLGELIDSGVEVHFANESLDLASRGGRLSADIQAVVAADFIRNLREETKKGLYGRLKQGLLPLPAFTGYLSQGPGKPKLPDPVQAPLVRRAFELYATGQYNIKELAKLMQEKGLRNRFGTKVSRHALERILHNPFYMGLIKMKSSGETFPGIHNPIVSTVLFQQVQDVLTGKHHVKAKKHDFVFRQLFTCSDCKRLLIGELQKGKTYYRCHKQGCPSATLPEHKVEQAVVHLLKSLEFSQEEKDYFRQKLTSMNNQWQQEQEKALQALILRLGQNQDRQNRLTDAYLDQLIDKSTYEQRKTALLVERRGLEEQEHVLSDQDQSLSAKLSDLLELASGAYLLYRMSTAAEKRELIKLVSSNRTLEGKTLVFTPREPFQQIATRFEFSNGCAFRDVGRVWDQLLSTLISSGEFTISVPALFMRS